MKKFLYKLDHQDGLTVGLIMLGPGLIVALLNFLSPWINLLPIQMASKARTWLPKFDADFLTVQQYYSTDLAEKFVLNQANLIFVTTATIIIIWPLRFLRPGVDLPSPEMKARGKPTAKTFLAGIFSNFLAIAFVFFSEASFFAEPNSLHVSFTPGVWGFLLSSLSIGVCGLMVFIFATSLVLHSKNWD